MKTARLGLLVFSCVLILSAGARGQCFGDDNFALPGTCCVPISTTNLPIFPPAVIPSDGACFLDCNVEAVFPVTITLGGPIFVFCDLYLIPVTITGSINTTTTFLVAKYARTWMDIGTAGTAKQVWRFIVNADLQYLSPITPPCPVPACAAAGLLVHVVGSVDYVRDCNPPLSWEVAINLTHLCGDMAHGPFSNRSTSASHPERLFAFVGPSPFNFFAPAPLTGGPVIADAARSTSGSLFPSFNWICYSELPISNGLLTNLNQACLCATSSSAPLRWDLLDLSLDYACAAPAPTNYTSLAWPPLTPTGLQAFPLGTYALPPSAYGSNQTVSVCFGLALGLDPCAANFPAHFVYGTATGGPNAIALFNNPVGFLNAIDLVNSKPLTSGPPFIQTLGYGTLFVSTMVWSANF